jgi:Flp pilus assembly protein TadG
VRDRAVPNGGRSEAGQSVIEFALVLPLVVLLTLGVVELSSALLDMHVVTSFSREGSNLISRNTTLQDAVTAMRQMSSRPVNLNDGSSKIILSVIKRVATTGAGNYNKDILYQRCEYGALAAQSKLQGGRGAFGPGPDYQALDADNDARLQVSNLPVPLTLGGTLYVTEVYTRHALITPLDRFGVHVPDQLYSIAYF